MLLNMTENLLDQGVAKKHQQTALDNLQLLNFCTSQTPADADVTFANCPRHTANLRQESVMATCVGYLQSFQSFGVMRTW